MQQQKTIFFGLTLSYLRLAIYGDFYEMFASNAFEDASSGVC